MSDGIGMKIPLVIDTALFFAGAVVAVLMYADIQNLKAQQVPSDRITRIEGKLDSIQDSVTDLKRQNADMLRDLIQERQDRERASQRR